MIYRHKLLDYIVIFKLLESLIKMKIDSLMKDPGPDIYYQKGFLDTLESYMDYFRNLPNLNTRVVAVEDKAIYKGDLYGYLTKIKIDSYLHWTIMRLNNMYSPYEFGEDTDVILTIPSNELDRIRQIYLNNPI